VKFDVEEIDDGLPEVRALIDAPLVQSRVVSEFKVVSVIDETPKDLHPGLADSLGAGLPQDFGHRSPLVFLEYA
jgi:hypothetical protein